MADWVPLLENHDLAPADRILADCQRLDIQLLTFSDAAYPGRLKNIYDPPALLYCKGRLPLLDDLHRLVHIVKTQVTWNHYSAFGMEIKFIHARNGFMRRNREQHVAARR